MKEKKKISIWSKKKKKKKKKGVPNFAASFLSDRWAEKDARGGVGKVIE
jgi:hypothetical protein